MTTKNQRWQNTITQKITLFLKRTDAGMLVSTSGLDEEVISFLGIENGLMPLPEKWQIDPSQSIEWRVDDTDYSVKIHEIIDTELSLTFTKTVSTLYDFEDETDAYGHLEYCVGSSDEDNHPEDLLCFDFQWVDDERLFLTCTWNTNSAIDIYSSEMVMQYHGNAGKEFVEGCCDWFYNSDTPVDCGEIEEVALRFQEDICQSDPFRDRVDSGEEEDFLDD